MSDPDHHQQPEDEPSSSAEHEPEQDPAEELERAMEIFGHRKRFAYTLRTPTKPRSLRADRKQREPKHPRTTIPFARLSDADVSKLRKRLRQGPDKRGLSLDDIMKL